jgi:hypothetical protein
MKPIRSWSSATWLRIALYAWLALAVAASVKTIIEPRQHTVYTAFSQGGRDWWDGHSLYAERSYYYSPTFAISMAPFAIWPDWFGGVLWNFVSVGLLVWSLRTFFRDLLASADKSALPAATEGVFHLLVLFGTVRSIWSGQSNAILVALVLFAAAAIVRGRWWKGAVLLAAPVYIKIWPIIAAGLFSVQWPKRLAARVTICIAALGLAPLLTKPAATVINSYIEWHDCLVNRQATLLRYPGYRDAWTIWEQFHSPVDQRAYAILQAVGGLAVLAWCIWQRCRGCSTRQLAIYTIAAWSVWQLLLGPGTERLTYNIIAPALAWAVLEAFRSGRGRAWIMATFATTFILGVGGVERLLIRFVPAATALEPVGVLMFAGWLVWHAATTKPMHDASEPLAKTELTAGTIAAHSRAA